jgi:hypothetical protein
MFKMFKLFNRFAEPVLSKVEGLKPFKTDSVPDIGPFKVPGSKFKVQRETGLLGAVLGVQRHANSVQVDEKTI